MIFSNKSILFLQLSKIIIIFVILFRFGNAQKLPNGKPIFFTQDIKSIAQKASFTNGEFYIIDSTWLNQPKTINENQSLYFLHFEFDEETIFHALLDENNFSEMGQLYLINPSENSWVGPYRKDYLKSELPNFTGRLKSAELIIEFSIPSQEKIKFPQIIIQTIPSEAIDSYHLEHRYASPKYTRERPIILLTGYWPPTNEAVRPFSQNSLLNPQGWIGENWEELGYDIVSFFPSFEPPDCEQCGQGFGDLEVDYQDTSDDWWNIVESLDPVAVITFSRGHINNSWELEWKYYNHFGWIDDFTLPYQPTPAPPDQDSPINHMRFSSLPMDEIVEAVNSSNLGLYSYIDYAQGAGNYLSEYKGFHGVWYKGLMENQDDTPCYLAGHVHVGGLIEWETAHEAVLITVRETIEYIHEQILAPGDINRDGIVDSMDLILILSHLNGISELDEDDIYFADMDEDLYITSHDVVLLVNLMLVQN